MTDFAILHRGFCGCVHDGWVPDSIDVDQQCNVCDQEFGYGVPITVDEGKLRAHLSCVVEEEIGERREPPPGYTPLEERCCSLWPHNLAPYGPECVRPRHKGQGVPA